MIADMQGVIECLASGTYEVTRFQPQVMIEGRVVAPIVATKFNIIASVQPATQKTIELMPEGFRSMGMIKIYSSARLQPASATAGIIGDRIVVDGEPFDVVAVKSWASSGNFFEIMAARAIE